MVAAKKRKSIAAEPKKDPDESFTKLRARLGRMLRQNKSLSETELLAAINAFNDLLNSSNEATVADIKAISSVRGLRELLLLQISETWLAKDAGLERALVDKYQLLCLAHPA